MIKKWGIKPYIVGLIFLSLLHFVFALRTNTFFSIDDFFEIAYFRNHSIIQFVPDFIVNGDINEFTRVTGFVAFALIQKLFGVNHLAFDAAMFVTHTINLILLFFVVRKLSKNDFTSFFVSLIFNKNYLFYYSNIHENLLALFSILTVFLLLYYPRKFYLAVVSFVLALFSKETAVVLPIALYTMSFFYKFERKKILCLFIVSIAFSVYAGYFFLIQKVAGNNFVYSPAAKFIDILRGYLFYINYKIIGLSVVLAFFTKKYKYTPLFVTVFIALTPAALLVNRREEYYVYMPFLYLMIYFGTILPKINIKNSILYLVVFVVFGGRSVLPRFAWQEFPNWQKESINHVLDRVETGSNDFSDLNLERDAKSMIGSGTTDLFLEARRKHDKLY